MTRILSNFKSLDQVIPSEQEIVHERLNDRSGTLQFLRQCLRADVVILNIDQRKLMLASLLRWLPFVRFRLVSVDLVLRQPKSAKGRLKASIKKLLLAGVDRFVLYFKNLEGYQRFYGIGPDRVVYVPFKVNGWESIVTRPRPKADGDFVLCAGRTLRDTVTFVEAMRHLDCPGVLLQQKRELLDAHGTSAWSGELPSNVKLIVDESDRFEDYLEFVAQARLVVIPRFKHDIAPTGISTYLVAMALNKCVIISDGPGAEDVLTDEAAIVPAENSEILATAIERVWNNEQLRLAIAARGHEYAMRLGGYERLFADVMQVAIDCLSGNSASNVRADTERTSFLSGLRHTS
jgi:glycosyltransferase involved in cell wall biosynthesis